MTPRFLKNQLGRSLRNMRVDCVDVFYLHNPESQLAEVSKADFLERIREAFTFLESAVVAGEIQYYGVATWNAFRQRARATRCNSRNWYRSRKKSLAGGTGSGSCSCLLIWE